MDIASLGSAGLVSSAIGLGTAAFSGMYGAVSRRDCARGIGVALNSGVTLLDTADFYGDGDTERLLGESVAGRRDKVLIATQGGMRIAPDGVSVTVNGQPEYLARACDASLRRLETDYVDVYYLSRVDPAVPVEESVGMLAGLADAGKIRYLGLCEPTPEDLRRAVAVHPVSVVAVEYSLRYRAAEKGIIATAAELGVGVVAYCPLARGLFGGALPTASETERRGLRAVEAEAAELDLGVARLALAWLSACRRVVPVPSSRSPAHLEMNASAGDIRLPPGTCARLDGIFAP